MTRAFDDLRFLAESEARLCVLEALSGGPHSRQELRSIASVSPATIGRILDGLRDRGWAVEEGNQWRATALGEAIAAEVDSLLAAMETARTVRDEKQ